eukprot:UN09120
MRTNGVTDSKSERKAGIMPVLTGNRSKSRSQSTSANHSMCKSMSVSPRSPIKRSNVSLERLVSPSPVHQRSRSPVHASKQKESRSPPGQRNMSMSPHRRSPSKSPPGRASRRPVVRRNRSPVEDR